MRREDFIAIDEWLDAIAERHCAPLSRIGIASSFVLLFCGVAAHAYESGFVQRIAARCGSPCSATPASSAPAPAAIGQLTSRRARPS